MSGGAPRIEDVLALSPLQEGLFSLSRLAEDGSDIYTVQFIADIDGPLDAALLRRSAEAMLVRHPNLRVAFWDQDVPRPVQIVPSEVELPWTECDATPEDLDELAAAEQRRPFDLTRGPALRVLLAALPPDAKDEARHRMIVTIHHILMDGWALALFCGEMLAIYRAGGVTDTLPSVRPYRDYIAWLAANDTATAHRRWSEALGRIGGPLIIADGGATMGITQAKAPVAPEISRFVLNAAETVRLQGFARANGLTLNTVVQFAWTMMLARLTDRRDVVYGAIVTGRPEQLAGVEQMIGLFLNTIPVPFVLDPNASVTAECARLQRESAALRDIGYLSLSSVQRAAGHSELFDTMFAFENAPIADAIKPVPIGAGVTFRPIQVESLTHYPLTVVSHMAGEELLVLVEAIPAAIPHLVPSEIGEGLLGLLRALPDLGAARVHDIEVLPQAVRDELLRTATTPALPLDADSVIELFRRQVDATPDALALTTDTETFSYRALAEAADRLAGELVACGVRPEDTVALCLPRRPEAIVAILATLAAGAAYVPVDPSLPTTRVESIAAQARPRLVLTVGKADVGFGDVDVIDLDDPVAVERISRRPSTPPDITRLPEHSAYVIFTSGSTGEPKGVIGTDRALVSYFTDHRERVYRPATAELGRKLRIAHSWSLSFDASWQPMVGLLDGHAIHLFDEAGMRDANLLVEGMVRHGIDMIDTTPSMLRQLAAAGLLEHRLAVLALGGEAIDTRLWARLRALPGIAVHNCYGPTETTVEAVVAEVKLFGDAPTIGTPNAGTSGYVLDSGLRQVPTGVVGELYLSGAQLARGYVGRTGHTAGRFVADPFRPGRRMYRTGDLVRRLPGGGFGYLGRIDDQVKIRGYRVEIGEIDTALQALPGVTAAATTVVRRAVGASLVGFVAGATEDPVAMRAALADRLPAYMVPARIAVLPSLPMNANGKVDARQLAHAAEQLFRAVGDGAVARTDTERLLGEVLAEVFEGAALGIDDDFFALGMDSIVAISLVNKARRRGLAVTPRMVLATPSIRDLAAAIDSRAAVPVAAAGDGDYGEVPPLPIVAWMFEHGSYRRFTQNVLLTVPAELTGADLDTVWQAVLDGHDTLRSRLVDTENGPRLVTREPGCVRAAEVLTTVDFDGAAVDFGARLAEASRAATDAIDPSTGGMVRVVWLRGAPGGDLLFAAIHHLAMDVVSWNILIADLADAWEQVAAGAVPKVLSEPTSYREWSRLLRQRAGEPEVRAQRAYWAAQVRDADPAIGTRKPDPATDTWSSLRVTAATTPVDTTARILGALTKDDGVREFLLAALTLTLVSWRRERGVDGGAGALIALEGHGRADAVFGTDTTSTLGWFTTVFPVRLGAVTPPLDVERAEADPDAARELLRSVAAHISSIPENGLDFGLVQQVLGVPELAGANEPQVEFNYLGRMDLAGHDGRPWSLVTDPDVVDAVSLAPEPDLPLRYALDVISAIGTTPEGPQLTTNWRWSEALFSHADAERLAELWQRCVTALAAALD
ncbi:non-ribosomal peptide synthetase [Nocardia bovistercoris]|uniref:Amino acid adenylation domain-containing protein n=1 Tax=Nocardia bovistercoris TaxID=2785916 RepID=A0A931IA21_9NOCA|nr:non-ribosomal peptide synthetase [Nocardia bovistercoris]MBH0777629.1 amino acid adenylation domain-containing protein [Nocardia bovistercoris]